MEARGRARQQVSMKGSSPMAKPKTPEPRTDLAAEVAPKLEAARTHFAELEEHVGAAALAVAIGELGAADRLTELNVQVEAARRDVVQLEAAHRLAEQRDAAAKATLAAQARQAQLAELQRCADKRLDAMLTVSAGLAAAGRAYTDFLDATIAMSRAFPTGVVQFNINWAQLDAMVDGRTFPAGIDVVIAGELWKHADPSRAGHACGALPGARPPTESLRLRPALIETAAEAVKRTNKYLVQLVKERFERMDAAPVVAAPVAPATRKEMNGGQSAEIPENDRSAIAKTPAPAPAPAPAQSLAAVTDIDPRQEYVPEAYRERLGRLLGEMARLANDISPAGQAKYQQVGDEIQTLQDEIERAKNGAAAA